MNEEELAEIELNKMITGYWATQAIFVAAKLDIADQLKKGPMTCEELAAAVSAHAASVYRLMRVLATFGLFAEDDQERFSLTPLGEKFCSDHPSGKRAFSLMNGTQLYQAWANLSHSVETGEPAFNHTFEMPIFEYLGANPELAKIFDAAMTGVHGGETEPMIDAYDFSVFETIVDLGAGNASVLNAILARNPEVKGIAFDLPHVIDHTRNHPPALGLEMRCELESGDFFSSVPSGANAYLMRHIIHDWSDEDATRILRSCVEAMAPEAKVLIVETVIPKNNEPCFGKMLDLMMLVIGGKERTEEEFRALLDGAGLKLERIIPTTTEVSIIEAVRS